MENKATRHEFVADTHCDRAVGPARTDRNRDRGRPSDIRTKEKSKGKTKRWSILLCIVRHSAALNRCDECYVVFSIIHRGGEQQKEIEHEQDRTIHKYAQ